MSRYPDGIRSSLVDIVVLRELDRQYEEAGSRGCLTWKLILDRAVARVQAASDRYELHRALHDVETIAHDWASDVADRPEYWSGYGRIR